MVKYPPANAGDLESIPGSGDPLEKEMATHSNILAWRIPWTEKPGGLQSMASQRAMTEHTQKFQRPLKEDRMSHGVLDRTKCLLTMNRLVNKVSYIQSISFPLPKHEIL